MNDDSVLPKMHAIRNAVDKPLLKGLLLKDRKTWRQLCSGMDVIEDSQEAINRYVTLPDFSDRIGYLYLYGLFQAFYTQQDAIRRLYHIVTDDDVKWDKDYPCIKKIRDLRNAVIHPTNRGGGVFFISRITIRKLSFETLLYDDVNKFQHHDVLGMIGEQQRTITELLDVIFETLQQKIKTHKMKFKEEKIVDKMSSNIGFHLEKIAVGISSSEHTCLAQGSLTVLTISINEIKIAIAERYGSLPESIEHEISDIEQILQRFEGWIKEGELFENKDAGIFHYALCKKIEELKESLKEIDQEFSQ